MPVGRIDGHTPIPTVGESVIRACDEHGFFDAPQCPTCGARGHEVLDDQRRTRLSKFLSGALRHFPADAGIELDDRGWTGFDDLVAAASDKYDWADRADVAAVAATDPKGRFERDDDRIRAAFGHSVDVSVDDDTDPAKIPTVLYHGTARDSLDSILDEGLEPMDRQRVHLSGTVDGAIEVGLRHDDDPVVLGVDAASMVGDGHAISKRGPETFTAKWVPPGYLDVLEGR